ncbi:phosphoribosyl-AMP cyclohydrolase [Tengunoibacter tsumagoiensis]|uniref:Histidine biosynthesis bifunctional protein HisIE n=1 Tax=Tengunoibacter tsumagoiensis TaxID=2014871 RepID=A0A402A128_9CHLR|nr:phosphoribosyl-AMP cyclohydrolase [Tengunoibacter tsumagoiensis]GCE12721.1 hypothetical protein KTT_25800 [Tengunoibacter tsumagoiensis]
MLNFDPQGLIPAVVVDDASGAVLMVAFMNEEAVRLTRESGQTHFFSRSRQKIWHKGEQSGNFQEVRAIFVNCEESSLLVRVKQHGDAACHDGYQSCYYRQLLPDDSYQQIGERVFDPAEVYTQLQAHPVEEKEHESPAQIMAEKVAKVRADVKTQLEDQLRQLYGVYVYLRDNDLSTESNTSRLLHESNKEDHSYLASRLADELQELSDVQTGEHVHSGRESDTILEGSQVGYWLFLLASASTIPYDTFAPHSALLEGYEGGYSEARVIELRQECLTSFASQDQEQIIKGLRTGFSLIGWACAQAGVSPEGPAEFDLAQMSRKGLVK